MRPARLISGDRLAVVLVAHGSRDPRAAAATEALARAVRRLRPRWDLRAAYLDHAGPRPLDVLATVPARRAVLVPLLLTNAYHGRVDIPAIVEQAANLPLTVTLADVLGPSRPQADVLTRAAPAGVLAGVGAARADVLGSAGSRADVFGSAGSRADVFGSAGSRADVFGSAGSPGVGGQGRRAGRPVPRLLIDALVRRLPSAGLDAVVLAAAGTRDPAARTTVEWAAEALSARLSLPCTVAYASAAPPTSGAAVDLLRAAGARRIGMAAYFLAPGYLYDLAAGLAGDAGAAAIAAPLTDAPELARLVATRVDAATTHPLAAA